MRYAKLAVGVLLLIAVIWVIVGEQLSGASADATINAPVVLLRAPVSGIVDLPKRQIGSSVAPRDVIATVSDPAQDRVRLLDIELEQEQSAAKLDALQAQKSAMENQLSKMKARSVAFHDARVAELETKLQYATRQRDLLKASSATAPKAGAKSPDLALELSRAQERVEILTATLAASRNGIYLGDGYNDAPYSEQRSSELAQQLADLSARIVQAKADGAALSQRLSGARRSVNRASLAVVKAGVHGIYWQELAHSGTYVNRGDPIARVVDCPAALVTASVPEMTYQRLQRGMHVTFRASGSAKLIDGVIVRLAGAGAAAVYQGLAVAPSAKHLQRYDVAISVPALADDRDLDCAIGRTGRVFFDTRPLDWLRGLF